MESSIPIKEINDIKNGKVTVMTILGVGLFLSIVYATHLSIKVNRLSLKKLKDEGYK